MFMQDEDDDSEEEDDTAELLAELNRIKKERAAETAAKVILGQNNDHNIFILKYI